MPPNDRRRPPIRRAAQTSNRAGTTTVAVHRTRPMRLGRTWPACEWLTGEGGANLSARWAFVCEVVLADDRTPAWKLDAAALYADRWGERELARALALAARRPGWTLDPAMAALARRLHGCGRSAA